MVGISRQTDYAARLVLHLASLPEGTRASIAEIAEARFLPAPFVRRLIGGLAKAGILQTTRGTGGGIALARPASEISLLDVVIALEGPIVLNQCLDGHHHCPLAHGCPIQAAWAEAARTLETHLAGVRFDALARSPETHLAAHLRCHSALRTQAASSCS